MSKRSLKCNYFILGDFTFWLFKSSVSKIVNNSNIEVFSSNQENHFCFSYKTSVKEIPISIKDIDNFSFSEIPLNKNYSEKISNTLAEIIFLALRREHLPLADVSFVDKIIDMIFKTNYNFFIISSIFYQDLPYQNLKIHDEQLVELITNLFSLNEEKNFSEDILLNIHKYLQKFEFNRNSDVHNFAKILSKNSTTLDRDFDFSKIALFNLETRRIFNQEFNEYIDIIAKQKSPDRKKLYSLLAKEYLNLKTTKNFTLFSDSYYQTILSNNLNHLDSKVSFLLGERLSLQGNIDLAETFFSASPRHYWGKNNEYKSQILGNNWPSKKINISSANNQILPKLTIIIPSYNYAQFIENTILSILNQNYDNLELIVIDGKSTDGTTRILEKYKEHFSYYVSEKDRGQTHAINKGISKATGEYITWINADDMLFPGALYKLSEHININKCDLMIGGVIEFNENGFIIYNRPLREKRDFSVNGLGDIFGTWLKGYFFYQPEVWISQKFLKKVEKKFDESLNFTMDYAFWLETSKHDPNYDLINYPLALFRKHELQKTDNLIDTVCEQFDVLEKFKKIEVAPNEKFKILKKIENKKELRFGFYSARLNRIFHENVEQELQEKNSVKLIKHLAECNQIDVLIYCVHLINDNEWLREAKRINRDLLIIGWFWDNHHNMFENQRVIEHLDAIIAGHSLQLNYLKSTKNLFLGHVPLCTTQFSLSNLDKFEKLLFANRSEHLHGGHKSYPWAKERENVLRFIKNSELENKYFKIYEPGKIEIFTEKKQIDVFRDWASCKASLMVPVNNDLSGRMFDCLLAGTIPIVPQSVTDFWSLFSQKEVGDLGLVSYQIEKPETIRLALESANKNFDKCGKDVVTKRHIFAKKNLIHSRISNIINTFEKMIAKLNSTKDANEV